MQITLPEQDQHSQDATPVERGRKRLHEFVAKFSHDWMMFSAATLAYSLMIAVIPFGIALLAVLGLTIGNLNPQAQASLVHQISNVFPSAISSQNVLQPAITRLHRSAGWLAMLAIVTAILGSSRLFIAIERCFDIVYRTPSRKLIPQYSVALFMLLVFIVLTPIMVLASSLPAIMLSLLQNSAFKQFPLIIGLANNGVILNLASLLGSVLVGWILFQAIYMVLPNQKISFKHSWRGAIVAAVLLEFFLALFPFYITHFMSSYTGAAGFAVIFLLFFYYFALILLLGAQINAYFSENVAPLPSTLATVLREAVGRNKSEPAEPEKLAQGTALAFSPEAAPGDTSDTRKTASGTAVATTTEKQAQSADLARAQTGSSTPPGTKPRRELSNLFGLLKHKKRPATARPATQKKARSKGTVVEAVAGTALAFAATMIHLRRKTGH